jgi:alpha-tubulin suppressor-like RCC1 family protein
VTASYGALRDSVRVRVRPVWKRVTVGRAARFACALSTDGSAFCWGAPGFGLLGRSTEPSRIAGLVEGGHHFTEIAAGFGSTCALEGDGTPYCWGDGQSGELGKGRESFIETPRAVPGGLHLASIVAGNGFFCGLDSSAALYCWGSNTYGELGLDPLTLEYATPSRFHATLSFAQLAAGAGHLCGISLGGALYCWGGNGQGQVGNGDRDAWVPPNQVLGVPAVGSVAAGKAVSCALDGTGVPYCWGFTPTPLQPGLHLVSLSIGDQLKCGRTAAGETWCGTTTLAAVQTPLVFTRVELGGSQACGLTAEGELYCWGSNLLGALGTGDSTDRPTPTRVVDPD